MLKRESEGGREREKEKREGERERGTLRQPGTKATKAENGLASLTLFGKVIDY